ncbi:TlpA disulfide reductase family protein [uncultured Campylobacter sp.]|uniref:TlpA family protein disulfide reductase n=1 Tax=uncultured Campylobacter sp. TaxID=218934 RepID=UPI0026084B37|nr:TlpA disulfide reductase family protein [uncultured Campylobacter sp.]
MKINLLIIPFLALFLSGCDNENKSDANKTSDATPTTTMPAPTQSQSASASIEAPFELTLMDESKMTLQKFDKGFKVEGNDEAILFNFFATWCPPCKAEIPHLNNLSDKFKGKLKIVSVLMEDKSKDEIDAFMKKFKINFGISYGENNFLFAKALGGVVGIPYMVLYKPNGEYATHYVGLVPEEMLESDINKVIN